MYQQRLKSELCRQEEETQDSDQCLVPPSDPNIHAQSEQGNAYYVCIHVVEDDGDTSALTTAKCTHPRFLASLSPSPWSSTGGYMHPIHVLVIVHDWIRAHTHTHTTDKRIHRVCLLHSMSWLYGTFGHVQRELPVTAVGTVWMPLASILMPCPLIPPAHALNARLGVPPPTVPQS
ncbi:hypothetical protein BDN70DRAFT_935983 [Pholiota conissans]|uniref:Uncharacterized protein n=1 Tax=Pholiota conissans TaxID=109636 RepID=A0A9P5YUC5_9AGAR|nr:hypothetical protein BDN70DRAFT_935983 [Pholiota conissans]